MTAACETSVTPPDMFDGEFSIVQSVDGTNWIVVNEVETPAPAKPVYCTRPHTRRLQNRRTLYLSIVVALLAVYVTNAPARLKALRDDRRQPESVVYDHGGRSGYDSAYDSGGHDSGGYRSGGYGNGTHNDVIKRVVHCQTRISKICTNVIRWFTKVFQRFRV